MAEATLENLTKRVASAVNCAFDLKEVARRGCYGADCTDLDPRALALVATKLEEAELWLTKVRQ